MQQSGHTGNEPYEASGTETTCSRPNNGRGNRIAWFYNDTSQIAIGDKFFVISNLRSFKK